MSRRRIAWGMGANLIDRFAGLALQLALLPILVTGWGLATYGSWAMLTAVPGVLALGDLVRRIGPGDASGPDCIAYPAIGTRFVLRGGQVAGIEVAAPDPAASRWPIVLWRLLPYVRGRAIPAQPVFAQQVEQAPQHLG